MRPSGRDDTESDREWIQLPDDYGLEEEDDFELFPENLQAFEVFMACSTQWTVSMAGPVGLNYPSVETCMRLIDIPKKERADVFWRVRCIERGALAAMGEKRNG